MSELLSIRDFRREGDGYVVEEFNERGKAFARPVTASQAAEIRPQWERARFDLERYARMPIEFPAPSTIPVELAD